MKQSELDRMNAVIKYSHSSFISNVVSENKTVRASLLEMSNQLEELCKIYEESHKSDFQARVHQKKLNKHRSSVSVATEDSENVNAAVLEEITSNQVSQPNK